MSTVSVTISANNTANVDGIKLLLPLTVLLRLLLLLLASIITSIAATYPTVNC